MSWPLSDEAQQHRLEGIFKRLAIDFTSTNFQDSENFLKAEKKDARFLENHAHYVEARAYGDEYLAEAKSKIIVVAEAVRAAIQADGRHGLCVTASSLIGRMLDEIGVWNYVAKATLTVEFSSNIKSRPRYFWALDSGDFYAPHAIVVAPPFGVIDVTAKYQKYDSEKQTQALPTIVLAEDFSLANWTSEDIANNELRTELARKRVSFDSFLQHDRPNMLEVMNTFPPRQVKCSAVNLKYVIVAVGGLIERLADIDKNMSLNGRMPQEIFEHDVLKYL